MQGKSIANEALKYIFILCLRKPVWKKLIKKVKSTTYVVQPGQTPPMWICLDVTLEVYVVSFLDIIGVERAAKAQGHYRGVWNKEPLSVLHDKNFGTSSREYKSLIDALCCLLSRGFINNALKENEQISSERSCFVFLDFIASEARLNWYIFCTSHSNLDFFCPTSSSPSSFRKKHFHNSRVTW